MGFELGLWSWNGVSEREVGAVQDKESDDGLSGVKQRLRGLGWVAGR